MNKQTKEVVLHLGLHKTGTTSIQDTLYNIKNKEILNENKITYVEGCWIRNNSIPVYSAFCEEPEKYHINVRLNLFGDNLIKYNDDVKSELKCKLNSTDRLVISGEDISDLNKHSLLAFKNFIEESYDGEIKFRVIIFVRDPIAFSNSVVQQLVKDGALDFETNRIIELIYSRIKKIYRVFNENDIEIHSFEQACEFKTGIVGYFFNILGVPESDLEKLEYSKTNSSLVNEAVKIAKYINETEPVFIEDKINLCRTENDLEPLLQIRGSKFSLPHEELKQIFKYIRKNLVEIRELSGIDYTKNIKKLAENEQVEDNFEELSLIQAYLSCTPFIKQCIIDYYRERNEKLADILNEISKVNLENKKLDYFYKLNTKPLEWSEHIDEIQYQNGVLNISSCGEDPYFILPEFNNVTYKTIFVKIDIIGTLDSFIEVFYAQKNQEFTQTKTIKVNIEQNKTSYGILINSSDIIECLRFDIGDKTATYKINNIEIYGDR